jgi:hypothetical protein
VALEGGYADISGTGFDSGGAMVRARLSRNLTPGLSAFVNGVREYPTSEATGLTADPTLAGGGSYDNSLLTAGPRLSTSYEGGLQYQNTRTSAELSYLRRKEESVLAAAGSRDYDEVRARVLRNFTPRVHGALYGAYSNEKYSQFAQRWDETLFGAELGITFGRSLGLDLRVERRDRDGLTRPDGYSELAGGLYLRYASRAGRR